ncbi:MAG: hypothetical protein DRI01_07145, partial [Chloroflexi bacterium]
MAAPRVTIREWDLSTRVPSFPGLYGGIAIPAKKGPVNKPYLVTSETQLLKTFTPNERVEVGYDLSYYSALAFLQKSNKLWVVRAAKGAKYGGVFLVKSDSALDNYQTPISLVAPEDYMFGADATTWAASTSYEVGARVVPTTSNGFYYECITAGTSSDTEPTWPTTIGDTVTDGDVTWVCAGSFDACLLVTGCNEGAWNNDIGVKIITDPDVVKEEGAFIVEVYKKDGAVVELVESFLCSRVPGAKDGYGRNIYVEDATEASNYIRIWDNTAIDSSILPKAQDEILYLARGDDGDAVTSAEMIQAIDKLSNPDETPLTVLMDGGWAFPEYQMELYKIAENRKDCVAILSTPYSAESSSDYVTQITNYRKVDLNADTSYAALFTPHVKVYDKFNDRFLYVAPDGYAAAAISETAANYEIWFAPAGPRRGVLEVLDVRRRFTEGEMDLLYDSGINPIRFKPGKGIAIWGQKTLLARPSSLDRLNVRLLLIVIEPAIKEALEDFLFEFNDAPTRALITAMI